MREPLVSIIIPCHNAGRWVADTLDSVLGQTWPHREIIVVDDGSQDNSVAVARGFEPRGVRLVTQSNQGASAARNHGLRLATGDFIQFLDADDLLSSTSVTSQVKALQDHPDCLAFGRWARFHADPTTAVFTPHPGWHDSPGLAWIKETWLDTEPMYQCGMFLIPRPLLERAGGWDERLSLIDDFEFFTRLALASNGLVFTPDAQLFYRSGLPGSLSGHKSRRAWESAILSTSLAVEQLLAREDTPETRRLGGSTLAPGGGAGFQQMAKLTGWRFASRIRHLLGRRPR
jgi:glycosyltransferase involved in cell wall biosynthesis